MLSHHSSAACTAHAHRAASAPAAPAQRTWTTRSSKGPANWCAQPSVVPQSRLVTRTRAAMTEAAPTLWAPQQQQQQQQQLSASQPWFEAAVQSAVRHLSDSTPLLVVVDTHPGLSIRVLQLTAAQASINWSVLQGSLGIANSSATILVQPVHSAEEVCAAASGSCPMAGPGGAAGTCPSAAAADAGAAAEVISGRVGDCCDGSDNHPGHAGAGAYATASTTSSSRKGSTSFQEAWDQQRQAQGLPRGAAAAATSPTSLYGGSTTERRFYGLVVQSQQQQHVQGCYLLKVSRTVQHTHGSGGCACTHYSLNRVCQNVPLRQQFVNSWLA